MTSSEFLDKDKFTGGFEPPPKGEPEIGAESTFDGALLFCNLPTSEVANVIPREFRLASKKKDGRAPDTHPVILILCHHSNLRWLLPDSDLDGLFEYDELVLMVPFVQRTGDRNWHSFVVRMYLDQLLAIGVGNRYYGFAKQKASTERRDEEGAPSTFKTLKQKTLYFDAALQADGDWRRSDAAEKELPHYSAMQEIVSMPVLGYKPAEPEYVCSYFQWDYSAAYVRPMRSRHEFVREFVDGMSGWLGYGIEGVEHGVVALRDIKWRLGLPLSCQY